MSQRTDRLLLELADLGKKLDGIRTRLEHGEYTDGCACDRTGPCATHAGISNQVDEARRQLHEAARATVLEVRR